MIQSCDPVWVSALVFKLDTLVESASQSVMPSVIFLSRSVSLSGRKSNENEF